MGVYKRGDVWWIDFTTPDGRRVRESSGIQDRDKALELHDRMKVRCWEEQRLGVKPDRSWQEAAVRWLKETSHKRSHDKDIAKLRWLDQFLGHLMLNQVSRDLIDRIGERKAKESSPANANRYLALIRSILRRARDDWEWIDQIPKVRLYREAKRRVRWITREQAATLLAVLPHHLREMAQFSLATGLRQRNVSFLCWDQVDMARKVAWIHADEAKAGRAIAVPLNDDALAVLRRRLEQHGRYVFTYQGRPVERCTTKAWQRACERAGIEDFRWHDLRHTWASWHVQSGTSLQELMELGGWATLEMVMRYAHLAADHLRTAACRIDGTFTSQSAKVHHLRAA
ncbi:tyrosine-type recombinase/integrase [Solimonas flava]|uniref:tyrosine-type recombinase/integrase n=1 Tax=Solimonas flava TaxID=415849 RepID=UPI0004855792|nr:site-specific integrase [Solimonas flava]